MKMTEDEMKKAEEAVEGFFDMLGPNDIYKQIFLEVFLEEVYGRKVDLSKVLTWKNPE